MNRRQRETEASSLRDEEQTLQRLRVTFEKARRDVEERIAALDDRKDMENIQSIVHQRRYQEAIAKQIDGVLDQLKRKNFKTVDDYIRGCYESGYLATMYDLAGQGIPVIAPINQAQVAEAVNIDSKLSKKLYDALGEDVDVLKARVRGNVSRAIAQGKTWKDAAVWLAQGMNSPYERGIGYAMRIARTEGHRVQTKAALDGMRAAQERGAKIVKQWDATLDGRTRKDHRLLDGQIRELDEDFEVRGHKCNAPGHFGRPEEDINCRCKVRQRATWALDEEELERLKERAKFHGLDKTQDFEDFKKKYLEAAKKVDEAEKHVWQKGDRVRHRIIDAEYQVVGVRADGRIILKDKKGFEFAVKEHELELVKKATPKKPKKKKTADAEKRETVGGLSVTIKEEEFGFGDGTANGVKKTVKAVKYTTDEGVTVVFPKSYKKAQQRATPEFVLSSISKMPEAVRARMQRTVEVMDYYNPRDSYWKKRYKNFSHSYMTGGRGTISIYRHDYEHDEDYFLYSLCHESGHGIDWQVTSDGKRFSESDAWTKAVTDDLALSGRKSPTSYGENAPAEDFAESVATYVTKPDVMRNDFPNRTALIEQILSEE